ncbi:hypothetical protein [Blautia sp.]|uniref:hypothetical protein n=1 Tax=Blautia sp. TaxID=1955243 RepID=UPI0035207D43
MKTVDIGLAQLAMHSVYETTGAKGYREPGKGSRQCCLHSLQVHWQIHAHRKAGDTESEQKAVFFDADGTLCDMEKGVPARALKEALKKAKRKRP